MEDPKICFFSTNYGILHIPGPYLGDQMLLVRKTHTPIFPLLEAWMEVGNDPLYSCRRHFYLNEICDLQVKINDDNQTMNACSHA